MTRPRLSAVKAAAPRKPTLAMVKKALRLFAGKDVPRAVRHANARKWLAAMRSLGDSHILNKKTAAKWGWPGQPNVAQIHAPRRLGERSA